MRALFHSDWFSSLRRRSWWHQYTEARRRVQTDHRCPGLGQRNNTLIQTQTGWAYRPLVEAGLWPRLSSSNAAKPARWRHSCPCGKRTGGSCPQWRKCDRSRTRTRKEQYRSGSAPEPAWAEAAGGERSGQPPGAGGWRAGVLSVRRAGLWRRFWMVY